jgi:hypothetical protein
MASHPARPYSALFASAAAMRFSPLLLSSFTLPFFRSGRRCGRFRFGRGRRARGPRGPPARRFRFRSRFLAELVLELRALDRHLPRFTVFQA